MKFIINDNEYIKELQQISVLKYTVKLVTVLILLIYIYIYIQIYLSIDLSVSIFFITLCGEKVEINFLFLSYSPNQEKIWKSME